MAKFKKDILKVGEYTSPDGTVIVTPERMDHWAKQFKIMSKSGLKIPTPWGHQGIARPKTYEEKEFWESKYNAGYLEDLKVENGILQAILEVPREEDADRIGKSIKEVSPQIETAWRDGNGRIWNDVITHLALVTHPVVSGQDNFVKVEDSPCPEYAMRLSLRNLIIKLDTGESDNMAKKNEDAVDTKEIETKNEKKPKGKEENESEKVTEGGDLSELVGVLEEIGLVLGDDVNEDNFMERLMGAALTLKNKIDELGGEEEGEEGFKNLNVPEEGEEKSEEEEGQKPEQENVQDFQNADERGGGKVQEEQPAMTMNLKKQLDNTTKRLSLTEKKLEESDKRTMEADIVRLLETGRIIPVIAHKLREQLRTYKLSLNSNGEPEKSFVQEQIEYFKMMPEGSSWSNDDKIRMRAVSEEALPSEFKTLTDSEADALAEKQLRYSGRGVTLGI